MMSWIGRIDRMLNRALGIESGLEEKKPPVRPPPKRELPGNTKLEQLQNDYELLDRQCREFRDLATSNANKLDMANARIRELLENQADNRKTEIEVYAELAEKLDLVKSRPAIPEPGREYQSQIGHFTPIPKDKHSIALSFLSFKRELELRAVELRNWENQLEHQKQRLVEMAASQRLKLEE